MNLVKKLSVLFVCLVLVFGVVNTPVKASEANAEAAIEEVDAAKEKGGLSDTAAKAIAVAIAIGLASCAGAFAMAYTGSKASESIARQPDAEGPIRTALMLNMVFIETAIIYALLAAILVIFVL